MIATIYRRPTFPSGMKFMDSWIIERAVFCKDTYELYKIREAPRNFGLVILCETELEAAQQKEKYINWWQTFSQYNIVLMKCDVCRQGQKYLVGSCISIPDGIISVPNDDAESVNVQKDAESLIHALINICESARDQKIQPFIEIESLIMIKQGGMVIGIPFFIKPSLYVEADCVDSIMKVVYSSITGISDLSHVSSLPSASRWNKNISKEFSALIGLCLAGRGSEKIETLSDLKLRLNKDAETNDIQGTLKTETNQPEATHENLKKSGGLSKVAGMKELKNLLIEEVIQPIRNPEPFKQYGLTIPNGILLFGPPGCGKTFIARQLAEELGFFFIEVVPSEIASPFIHSTVLKIRDVFEKAEQHAPSIVFIDEFEALVPSRSDLGSHQQYKSEEVNEFLVHLNECAGKNVFVIAATNEPDKIDQAIRRTGRLDKIIYVGPPDMEARIELLKMYLNDRPTGKIQMDKIGSMLESYSCSDIRNIVDESARIALKEGKPIMNNHLVEAIQRNPSGLSEGSLSKYLDFKGRGM